VKATIKRHQFDLSYRVFSRIGLIVPKATEKSRGDQTFYMKFSNLYPITYSVIAANHGLTVGLSWWFRCF